MPQFRYRLAAVAAAAAAAAGVAAAQPVQIIDRIERRLPGTPAEPTGKPADAEFKPAANASPDPKTLAVPDDLFQKSKELAAKLGSADFAERRVASAELAKMGRMALPALQEVVGTSESAEAVQRAEVLLPKAEGEDMKARVACFLADKKGEYTHTLPGWEKFKAVAGNDKASRDLFAEALGSKTSHQMLLAADKTADEANAVLNAYVTKLQGGNRGWDGGGQPHQVVAADVAMAIFLEGLHTDREVVIQPNLGWFGGNQYWTVMNNIYSVGEGSAAVSGGTPTGKAAVLRKLVLQWMDTRETGQGVQTAYQYAQNIYGNTGKADDRKKVLKYAAKVLEADNGVNGPWNKINVLTQFGQQGAKEYLPAVVKAFDDSANIWQAQNGNPGFDIQLRDYALVVAVQMTDQKPEDYGFARTPGTGTGKQWNQQAFYFKDDTAKPGGPPNGGGGVIVRPRPRPVPLPKEEPKEEPKPKDDPKKEDPKKEEKLSQDDRRKAAFKQWEEWYGKHTEKEDKKDDKKEPKADPKAEPKKDGKPSEPPPPVAAPGGLDRPAPDRPLPPVIK